MSSTYGESLRLSIFGQSHGPAIGMVLDGIPAGLPVDEEALRRFMSRRAPGSNSWSTPRKEADIPEFLGGLLDGYTCGAPIAAVIRNSNTRSSDYESLRSCPRPGHADYTADVKYGGFQDAAGGGHFSGRLTAPLCIAGGLCLQWLEAAGVRIKAHVLKIGDVCDAPISSESDVGQDFPTVSDDASAAMRALISQIKERGDSIGGTVECIVSGLPAGVGEPMFGGIESKLSQIIFGIPAVKGIDFGEDPQQLPQLGSVCNDPLTLSNGRVITKTNHCGGILGGISNGMDVLFRVRIKPTPSISAVQYTLDLASGRERPLQVPGRHDPCIVPRAVPVIEAATALAVYDLILGNTQTSRRK